MTTHDETLDPEALFTNHKQTGEPLGGHEVRAIVDAGLAKQDDFDMTGGDLWSHSETFPDPNADEAPPCRVGLVNIHFGAAAYGDRDYGDGPTRLFTIVYDHEPTHEEIRQDAFVAAVSDWQHRYPNYTLHAAAYQWEGTLTDALIISIIPADGGAPPSHRSPTAVTTTDDEETGRSDDT